MLETAIIVVHLCMAIGIVALVLLQQGKGAEAGASFGAGASATVFGSQGSATFLSRFTAILTAIFFATSLALGYFAKHKANALANEGLPAAVQSSQAVPQTDVPVLEQKTNTPISDVPPASGAQ